MLGIGAWLPQTGACGHSALHAAASWRVAPRLPRRPPPAPGGLNAILTWLHTDVLHSQTLWACTRAMTEAKLQPLAAALVAAVLGRPLTPEDAARLEGGAFGAACSFRYTPAGCAAAPAPSRAPFSTQHPAPVRRVVLPLGYGGPSDAALVSSDLRRSPGALTYWATPGAASLAGRTLAAGRTGLLEGDQ